MIKETNQTKKAMGWKSIVQAENCICSFYSRLQLIWSQKVTKLLDYDLSMAFYFNLHTLKLKNQSQWEKTKIENKISIWLFYFNIGNLDFYTFKPVSSVVVDSWKWWGTRRHTCLLLLLLYPYLYLTCCTYFHRNTTIVMFSLIYLK